ncbi:MAG: hypothetical protein KTR27_20660 [Leptolyngbyaceae cyanobacterium MAG.088]|nr:hypothetical protein [Leptolyngbyaceae cyanobacterium MAG.088]
MNTTDLFVELIVIGVGATIWVVLLVLGIFGYGWVPFDHLLALPSLLPILAITYIFGIVTDRAADSLFDTVWKSKLVQQFYVKDGDDYDDRRYIYLRSERLASLLEYGRSRLRICRGWVLNTTLILISLDVFILRQVSGVSTQIAMFLFSNLFLILLIYGLWFSWKQLTLADYRKVKRQSAWLKSQQ